jgi:hypothetical protein
LQDIIDFPTRICKTSHSVIVNIFINKSVNNKFTTFTYYSGLSDHDAQVLILNNRNVLNAQKNVCTVRIINGDTILKFKLQLSYEVWEEVFADNYVDAVFNNFLTTHLRAFYHCFLLKKFNKMKQNYWITKGIKISSTHKRDLYLLSRSSNNPIIKDHYKNYSEVSSDVIKAAKRLCYNNKIVSSTNKMKTIWQIVKTETNTNHKNHNIPLINISDILSDNYQTIVNKFNRYFANIANQILTNNSLDNNTTNSTQFLEYLYKAFNNPFPSISLTPTNTYEIRNIIKKLKTKNSSGCDEISMKILKISTPYIISPLTHITNKTLSTGTSPSRLKYA